ncbi:hypothetical protein GCM10022254_39690 [Actinomadura meridiana]|uniref:Uncharacterized protein n=1 Tax=Actinomadura meridiana TaxID=559626 RepID=A0ABP8C6I3_9ACTN
MARDGASDHIPLAILSDRGSSAVLSEVGQDEPSATRPGKGGGLVFPEIKERRQKIVSVAPELVALLKVQWSGSVRTGVGRGPVGGHGVVFT